MTAPPDRPTRTRTGRTTPAEQTRLRAAVGGVLRRERIALGWTQAQLAAAAGLRRQTVVEIETGAGRPSESSTRRLARALRAGRPPIEVAMLDVELRRAAGPSLRRWRRRRTPSPARVALYAEAAARLDGQGEPTAAGLLFVGRLDVALSAPWEPPC